MATCPKAPNTFFLRLHALYWPPQLTFVDWKYLNEVPMEASAAENEEIQKDSPLVFVPTLAARQALKDLEALGAKPSEFWDAVKRSHLKTVSKQMLRENVKKVIPHSKKLSLRKSNKRVGPSPFHTVVSSSSNTHTLSSLSRSPLSSFLSLSLSFVALLNLQCSLSLFLVCPPTLPQTPPLHI